MRVDKFIMMRIANSTRTKIQNACDAGFVLVNGKATKSNYKIKPLDEISIMLTVPPGVQKYWLKIFPSILLLKMITLRL